MRLNSLTQSIASPEHHMPHESQDEQPNTLDAYSKKLYGLGLQKANFDQHISGMRALQSQRTGVSQRYLKQRSFGALVHFVEKTW